MGDLLKYVGKGRGFNFKKLNGILIFSCYQFSRCFQVSLLLYETIVFLKFEHGQIIIYVHVFDLIYNHCASYPLFCEFLFTGFTLQNICKLFKSPFLANPHPFHPYILVFCDPPPPKNRIFQTFKFFIVNSILYF